MYKKHTYIVKTILELQFNEHIFVGKMFCLELENS